MATVANILDNTPLTQATQFVEQVGQRIANTLASNPSIIITAGDFGLDIDSRIATVRGERLELSCAEFDVLVFLISHRKRIVTSSTSLATKRDECGVQQARFMPALLSLRKKLQEVAPGNQYIQTEAWILYDFHPGV